MFFVKKWGGALYIKEKARKLGRVGSLIISFAKITFNKKSHEKTMGSIRAAESAAAGRTTGAARGNTNCLGTRNPSVAALQTAHLDPKKIYLRALKKVGGKK